NHINVNRSSDNDQQRILCIRVENNEAAESIQDLLVKHASIFRDIRIIDLKELIQFIQSRTTTTTNITYEDASTMTNIDHMCHQITSCASFITQNENVRRLKALEYIRIFLEMNKEEFFNYLINEEHLCQQKTLTIYQMIKLFLKAIYQSEHEQKQTNIGNFCRPVNLSPTRYFQFQTFLSLLQLNEKQLLVINCYASPLQLRV
ncbi:unnamed protein product, partial [Rotaria sp. Silwood1]